MKERLIIQNFGPIKSVDLELGKLTVLIGEQATGKSIIAKVLSICRYFSYVVNFTDKKNELNKFTENQQFLKGLNDWGIEEYLNENSKISYEDNLYLFEFKNDKILEFEKIATSNDNKKEFFEPHTRISAKSDSFRKLLDQFFSLHEDELKENKNDFFELLSWTPNENFFRLNVKKVMNNPLFIPAERGFQSLSVGKDSFLPNAILDELAKINKIVRGYNVDINIKPLELVFRNVNGLSKVKKADDNKFYFLHNGASGFQSTIPVFLAVKFNDDFKTNSGRTIIVEDPELNLFPKVQKKMVEFFIESINQHANQFLLPTHSPYILTSIENLMYAHKLGNFDNGIFEDKVSRIVDEKFWIDPNNVNAYYLNNGKAKDIMLRDDSLIDKSNLDEISDIIGETLDSLLKIEMDLENIGNT